MEDLWPHFAAKFPTGTEVHFVRSMERADLEAALPATAHFASFIGLGGGQAIDAAKYFAWRHGRKLHQFPTSLAVDAMYGQRAGVRDNRNVRYVGWAIPECVYFDYDIMAAAPAAINHAGIGDVFCFFTGVWDWDYASRIGRCEAKWPYDPGLAAHSLKLAEAALAGRDHFGICLPRASVWWSRRSNGAARLATVPAGAPATSKASNISSSTRLRHAPASSSCTVRLSALS